MSRALPHALIRHALAVMPPARRPWGRAMAAEIDHIPEGREALIFAVGCLLTGYRERLNPMALSLTVARWAVALVTALTAAVHLFVSGNIAAIMLDLSRNGLGGWAGGFPAFQGQTSDQALAALSAIPLWQHGAMIALAAIYAAAAWSLVRWNPRRFGLTVLAGFGLVIAVGAAMLVRHPMPYLFHVEALSIEGLALTLLAIAGAAFWTADRLFAARPAAA